MVLSLQAPLLQADILDDCRALTTAEDEIHNCLDNFLDLMDDNMVDLVAFVTSELSAGGESRREALTAFENSQQSFETFRRENCLWYLAFSSPRVEAEQIAKNCLATLSQQRLSELQSLINDPADNLSRSGYYVYGAERNTFQPCGEAKRYWVEGDNVLVSQLQQGYLSKSSAVLQILYVSLRGDVDQEAGSPYAEHDGVFRLTDLQEIRIPTDNDCQIPVAAKNIPTPSQAETQQLVTAQTEAEPEQEETTAETAVNDNEPIQSLTGYFGDWVAHCEQRGERFGCVLSVPLQQDGSDELIYAKDSGSTPVLRITRRSGQRTVVDAELPDVDGNPAVEDVDQISWSVDKVNIGKVLHSRLNSLTEKQTGQAYTQQALRERWFIRDELLPLLQRGATLKLQVQSEQISSAEFRATLKGLSRALAFADDFTVAELEQ